MTQPTNIDYKAECLKIYYASDVCDKTLSFGCEVIKSDMWRGTVVGEAYEQVAYLNEDKMQVFLAPADQFKIIGHPPTLAKWLLLMERKGLRFDHNFNNNCIDLYRADDVEIRFSLTTEEPTDWQKLYEIIQ